MTPEIERITHEDIKHLVARAAKEGVSATNARDSEWCAIRVNGVIVAFASRLKINVGYRLRAAWVNPDYRNRGFYTFMMKHLLDACDRDCASVEVLVGDMLPFWLKRGFRVVSRNGNGIARMRKLY